MTKRKTTPEFSIGDLCLLTWNGLTMTVAIKDTRVVFGRREYLVSSMDGERWVQAWRLSSAERGGR